MPTEHISISYKYAELSPDAQERAVEAVQEKMSGDWWDGHDNNDIQDAIVYALANAIGEPKAASFGEGDYPGIPGVSLESWRIDWNPYATFSGALTRENAPSLPWPTIAAYVTLKESGEATRVAVTDNLDECACDPYAGHEDSCTARDLTDDDKTLLHAFEGIVATTLSEALKAGETEYEYKISSEYARDYIENNEPEFTADGGLF